VSLTGSVSSCACSMPVNLWNSGGARYAADARRMPAEIFPMMISCTHEQVLLCIVIPWHCRVSLPGHRTVSWAASALFCTWHTAVLHVQGMGQEDHKGGCAGIAARLAPRDKRESDTELTRPRVSCSSSVCSEPCAVSFSASRAMAMRFGPTFVAPMALEATLDRTCAPLERVPVLARATCRS